MRRIRNLFRISNNEEVSTKRNKHRREKEHVRTQDEIHHAFNNVAAPIKRSRNQIRLRKRVLNNAERMLTKQANFQNEGATDSMKKKFINYRGKNHKYEKYGAYDTYEEKYKANIEELQKQFQEINKKKDEYTSDFEKRMRKFRPYVTDKILLSKQVAKFIPKYLLHKLTPFHYNITHAMSSGAQKLIADKNMKSAATTVVSTLFGQTFLNLILDRIYIPQSVAGINRNTAKHMLIHYLTYVMEKWNPNIHYPQKGRPNNQTETLRIEFEQKIAQIFNMLESSVRHITNRVANVFLTLYNAARKVWLKYVVSRGRIKSLFQKTILIPVVLNVLKEVINWQLLPFVFGVMWYTILTNIVIDSFKKKTLSEVFAYIISHIVYTKTFKTAVIDFKIKFDSSYHSAYKEAKQLIKNVIQNHYNPNLTTQSPMHLNIAELISERFAVDTVFGISKNVRDGKRYLVRLNKKSKMKLKQRISDYLELYNHAKPVGTTQNKTSHITKEENAKETTQLLLTQNSTKTADKHNLKAKTIPPKSPKSQRKRTSPFKLRLAQPSAPNINIIKLKLKLEENKPHGGRFSTLIKNNKQEETKNNSHVTSQNQKNNTSSPLPELTHTNPRPRSSRTPHDLSRLFQKQSYRNRRKLHPPSRQHVRPDFLRARRLRNRPPQHLPVSRISLPDNLK